MTFSTISIRIAIFVIKDDENSCEISDLKHLIIEKKRCNSGPFQKCFIVRGFDKSKISLFLNKPFGLWNQ